MTPSPAVARLALLALLVAATSLGLALRLPCPATAVAPTPDGDLATWYEVAVPPVGTAAYESLRDAAVRRPTRWLVTVEGGTVTARDDYPPRPVIRPPFAIELTHADPEQPFFSFFHARVRCATEVEDGWLVGFNGGEWGGGACWFSADGRCCRVLAPGNVTALVPVRGGYLAVGGLQHLALNEGWVYRLASVDGRWVARKLAGLPSECVSAGPDGRGGAVVATSDGLLRVGPGGKVAVLAAGVDWFGDPASVALGPAGSVYVGMQGYVAVVGQGKVRLLAPPASNVP